MAPLPPESTARYVVHYRGADIEHDQVWRTDGSLSPVAMESVLTSIWTDIGDQLFPWEILGVDFIADGQTVANPVSMPTFVGMTGGTGTWNEIQAVEFLNFIGRSTAGRRVRLSFYAPNFADFSFRVSAGENADVAATIADLNATNQIVAIDGLPPVWKNYANWGVNAYWQRAQRS